MDELYHDTMEMLPPQNWPEYLQQMAHGLPGRVALRLQPPVVGGQHGGHERAGQGGRGAVVGRLVEGDELGVER